MSMSPLSKRDQPIHWILDWDGTMTKKDTLNALVNISAAEKPGFPTMTHWQRVSQAYMDDYNATLKQLVPNGAFPTTIDEEKRLLGKLEDVERRSLDRVYSSGIFTGLTRQGLEAGASQAIKTSQVQLRTGFSSFAEHIQSREGDAFAILSVNWSRHFIHSCLAASSIAVPLHAILSNELDGIPSGEPSSGRIVAGASGDQDPIVSSGDKLQRFKHMQQVNMPKVYIGDSWTDIECLLAADLGVCIRDDPMGSSQKTLAEALTRLGVACPRLKDLRQNSNCGIVWAKDFVEVLEWLETRS
jgi:2-hydroxy-3-keto-5-methylthiopentenyl-1-phosphate phosphatase